MGGTSSQPLVQVGILCPSVAVPGAVAASLYKKAESGLAGLNVGRPTEGGVHRLVLVCVGEDGARGGDCADRLGEDITANEEELVRYGEPTGPFELGFAMDLRWPPPRKI
jgi:hypothetical protein